MKNYYFNNEDPLRPYTITLDATEGTLPPDNALRIEPEKKEGYWPCEKNGKWIYIEDHRKTTIYNPKTKENEDHDTIVYSTETKEEVTVDYLGPIKKGFTTEKPPKFAYWVDGKWKINEEELNNETIKDNKSLIESLINSAETEVRRIELLVKYNKATEEHLERLRKLELYISDLYILDSNDKDIVIPELP